MLHARIIFPVLRQKRNSLKSTCVIGGAYFSTLSLMTFVLLSLPIIT